MSDTAEKHEFEMNKKEQEVKAVFDLMRTEGIDVPTAARYSVTVLPKPRTKFIEWLSDGTLTAVKGQVVAKDVA